jgi:hypothetical protein
MVTAGLIGYDAEAIKALLMDEISPEEREQVLGLDPMTDGYGAIKTPNYMAKSGFGPHCSQIYLAYKL